MKNRIRYGSIIFIAFSLIFDLLLITTLKYPFKVAASASFMVVAALNYINVLKNHPDKKKPATVLTIGVFVIMAADIVINLNFLAGTGIFIFAHIFYLIAYSMMRRVGVYDIIAAVCIFSACAALMFSPFVDFGSPLMTAVCTVYAVIISFMTSRAVMNYIKLRDTFYLVIAVGSVLFILSDIMLMMDRFSCADFPFQIMCRVLYYPGQCMISASYIHADTIRSGASDTEG